MKTSKFLASHIRQVGQAYDVLGDAVNIADADDVLIYVNSACERLYGYSKDELVGSPLSIVVPPSLSVVTEEMISASPDEQWEGEITRLHRNGEEIPVHLTVTLIRDLSGNVVARTGILRDLTVAKEAEDAISRLAEDESTLAEIGRTINSLPSVDEAYEPFAIAVKKLIPFDRLGLTTVDLKDDTITHTYFSGLEIPEWDLGETRQLNGTSADPIIKTRSGLFIRDISQEAAVRNHPSLKPALDSGLRSLIAEVLFSGDRTIGILNIWSAQENAYSNRHRELAERVSNQISGAIANSQLSAEHLRTADELRISEEAAQRLADEQAALAEIGRIINATLDIGNIYEQFAERVAGVISFDRIVISTLDRESGTLNNAYVSGVDVLERRVGASTPLEGSLGHEACKKQSSVIVHAKAPDEFSAKYPNAAPVFRAGFRSFLSSPLISNDEVIGVLHLRSFRKSAYTKRDAAFCEQVAAQVAGAVVNDQLHSRLLQESKQQAVLAEIGRIIGSSLEIDEVYERFVDEVKEILSFDRIVVTIPDPETRTFRNLYVSGLKIPDAGKGATGPFDGTVAETVVRDGTGVMATAESPEEFLARFPNHERSISAGLNSYICAPCCPRVKF